MRAPHRSWQRVQLIYRRSTPAPRDALLLYCLISGGSISLLFYFLAPPIYERSVNLLAAMVFWVLASSSHFRWIHYTWICNLALLNAVSLMAYIATVTGGINSPALAWLTIMSIPALLLLGQIWAWSWLGVISLVIVMQWMAVALGWISGIMEISHQTILWATMDKILIALTLMFVVNFYERIHQARLKEVEESNQALEAAQQTLAQTQSHKDDFMASVGHEIRTPMNAILGLNSVLQGELADQPDKMEIAVHIRESTEQLLQLVNDILDFSQLEAGRMQLLEKPLQLQKFLQAWMPAFLLRAHDKGLQLRWEVDPHLPSWLMADAPRLRQILVNLLDNALKFTDQGKVHLRVMRSGENIRFEVQDSGRGIAPDRQKDIFNRFEHADIQIQRRYGGTGLGLAICEQLVKLHGGRIGVQSLPGQGACFWFEWTLRTASAPMPKLLSGSQAERSESSLQFLVVDDNPVNLMVAQRLLQQIWPRAQISSATSGEQTLLMLEQHNFDLVLMDMHMPGLDGPQTTMRLRQHPRPEVANTPVIAVTASNSPHDLENCLTAGMNETLTKPIDKVALRDAVKRLVLFLEKQ